MASWLRASLLCAAVLWPSLRPVGLPRRHHFGGESPFQFYCNFMNYFRKQIIHQAFVVLFAAALVGVHWVSADQGRTLTRDQAIRLAFQNNREIGIAELEIRRASSRLEWSGRLENPELEVSASGDGVGLNEGEGSYEVAFTQSFPLTSKLKHEKGLRSSQVILAEAEIAEKRRELGGMVDEAIVDLLATREGIRLERQLVVLNKEIVSLLSKQAEQGQISRFEVTQASLNGRTRQQSLKSLEAIEKQERLNLNRLLGLDPTASVRLSENLDLPGARPSMDVSLERVLTQRPDYVLALAKIDEANASIVLEEASRWDDLSVKLFVEGEESVDVPRGLERNTFAGVGFSFPLPFRKRNQDGIAQAQIDRESADKEVDAARFRIRAECEGAFHERTDAWSLAREASGEILQLAEDNLAGFRTAYEQGQASIIKVQMAQQQILEFRTAAIEFAAAYHRASARVRLATGAYPGLSASSPAK